MSDNFVHLLILLGVAGGAIPTRHAPTGEVRPTAVTVAANCRGTVEGGTALQRTAATCGGPARNGGRTAAAAPPSKIPAAMR